MVRLCDVIRNLCAEVRMSQGELARRTGQSPSNFSRKLKNDTIDFKEFQQYLDILGARCELKVFLPDGSDAAPPENMDNRTRERIGILESQLSVEKKKLGYFLAVSHDLRTSFDAVTGATELALSHSGDTARVEECLEKMRLAENNIIRLVNDSLSIYGLNTPFAAVDDAADDVTAAELAGLRLLLVDDSDINRDIVKNLLEDYSLRVEAVSCGEDALVCLAAAAEEPFDVVLMDIEMPGMNGFETTRKIRALADSRPASVPVVALTANTDTAGKQRALAAGMNDYLEKPTDIQTLLRSIRRLSGR